MFFLLFPTTSFPLYRIFSAPVILIKSLCLCFISRQCTVRCCSHNNTYAAPQVSWVKRKGDELNLITFGHHTYSSDSRFSLEYKAPNDWQLYIQYANERDDGNYECQVSAHPPMVLTIHLTVIGEFFHLAPIFAYIKSHFDDDDNGQVGEKTFVEN